MILKRYYILKENKLFITFKDYRNVNLLTTPASVSPKPFHLVKEALTVVQHLSYATP